MVWFSIEEGAELRSCGGKRKSPTRGVRLFLFLLYKFRIPD
jgi:hypothetical protein